MINYRLHVDERQSTTDNGVVAAVYDTAVFMTAVGITPLKIQYKWNDLS